MRIITIQKAEDGYVVTATTTYPSTYGSIVKSLSYTSTYVAKSFDELTERLKKLLTAPTDADQIGTIVETKG